MHPIRNNILKNINKLIPILNYVNFYLEVKNELIYIYNSNNFNIIILTDDKLYNFTKLFYLKTNIVVNNFNTAHYIVPSYIHLDCKRANINTKDFKTIYSIKGKYINLIRINNNNNFEHDLIPFLKIIKTTKMSIYYRL